MIKRVLRDSIKFQLCRDETYQAFGDNRSYHILYDGAVIGTVQFVFGEMILNVGEISIRTGIPFDSINQVRYDIILEQLKSQIIDMYHKSIGTIFDELLTFKHRDPGKIGNGLHDYDVMYDGNVIGKLIFPTITSFDNIKNTRVVFILINTSESFYIEMSVDQYDNFDSNKDILNSLRPDITNIMTNNKITCK